MDSNAGHLVPLPKGSPMFTKLPVVLSAALFAMLSVSAVDSADAAPPACGDSMFFGDNDPGGADLCDPSTDPALEAGVAQCSAQGGGFWCCDGADCTCFCDEADADAYCGGFLGQATCQGNAATCDDFYFFGAADPGGADLCDPSTDPALEAGVAQCGDQGGGFWCCDGADCTCFCDEADADAYCGDFLGQATCQS